MTVEIEGLLYDEAGRPHRPIAPDWWERPRDVRLIDGRIVPLMGESDFIGPGRGMFESFLALADGSDQQILSYARTWGPLELCAHGMPPRHDEVAGKGPLCEWWVIRHTTKRGDRFRKIKASNRYDFHLIEDSIFSWGVERPDDWRTIAAHFADLVVRTRQPVEVLRRLPWQEDPFIPMHRLIGLADVKPTWHVPRKGKGDAPQLLLGSFSLLGALVVALLYTAVGGGTGLAHCAGCGDWFSRSGGQRKDRRAWCSKPACQLAKRAAASRAYRDRLRSR